MACWNFKKRKKKKRRAQINVVGVVVAFISFIVAALLVPIIQQVFAPALTDPNVSDLTKLFLQLTPAIYVLMPLLGYYLTASGAREVGLE